MGETRQQQKALKREFCIVPKYWPRPSLEDSKLHDAAQSIHLDGTGKAVTGPLNQIPALSAIIGHYPEFL